MRVELDFVVRSSGTSIQDFQENQILRTASEKITFLIPMASGLPVSQYFVGGRAHVD